MKFQFIYVVATLFGWAVDGMIKISAAGVLGQNKVKPDWLENSWVTLQSQMNPAGIWGLMEFGADALFMINALAIFAVFICFEFSSNINWNRAFGCGMITGGLAALLMERYLHNATWPLWQLKPLAGWNIFLPAFGPAECIIFLGAVILLLDGIVVRKVQPTLAEQAVVG